MEPEYASVGKETGLDIENELTPSGISGGRLKLNVGESRMRAKYWRPLPNGEWVQTGWLPADQMSMAQYFGKGFKGKPPVGTPVDAPVAVLERAATPTCPFCDFEPKNALSLRTHLTKHVKEDKEETNELS